MARPYSFLTLSMHGKITWQCVKFWQRSGNDVTTKKPCYIFCSKAFTVHKVLVVGRTRFELVTNGLKVRCSTN